MEKLSWIRKRRLEHGLSQANLARITDITQARISAWELAKSQPSAEEAAAVEAALERVAAGEIPAGLLLRNHRRSSREAKSRRPGRPCERFKRNHEGFVRQTFTPDELKFLGCVRRPRAIACFAGCGGMSLGFRKAGFTIVGFVELDPAARETFRRNFAASIFLADDIRCVAASDAETWRKALGPIDVICGGPPCQGFSLAGKRDRHDDRNLLFHDYLRVAEAVEPKIIVMENVRLLTSMKAPDGRLVTEVITERFAHIGYVARFMELNAQDYGVPQFRERVFFIAIKSDVACSRKWFPERTHGESDGADLFDRTLQPYRTFRDATGDLEPLESGERSVVDPYHWAVKHPQHVIRWLKGVPEGKSAHENADSMLRPPSGYNTTYKRLRWDEPCSTIGTTFGMISACRNVHPVQTRSLTIREAMRCQTFPDAFVVEGTAGQRRTQIGNAVPPLLAQVLADHIMREFLDSGRVNPRMGAC